MYITQPLLMRFLYVFVIVSIFSCEKEKRNENRYNTFYKVDTIPGGTSFQAFNRVKAKLEIILPWWWYDSLYQQNRGRIFTHIASHGKVWYLGDTLLGEPAICNCSVINDTLLIEIPQIATDPRNGITTYIKVFKNRFITSFFYHNNNIFFNSKFQSLILGTTPNFKVSGVNTGLLSFRSEDWWMSRDSFYYSGKIYFTCQNRTKEAIQKDFDPEVETIKYDDLLFPNDTSFIANVLIPGSFHSDEVWEGAEKENWFGLFKNQSGFYLAKTKIKIENIFDAIMDNEGEKTGKEVSTSIEDEPVLLISGLNFLDEHKIES